ncbi:hypothetical protein [Albidovulum sp.]|uniref:hypothetical protein n=1 Tax=Albidovulum sp. TaxID=1872424 RepID=UPI0035297C9B
MTHFLVAPFYAFVLQYRLPVGQMNAAALNGSSHYILPPVLRWLSGKIGIHHLHRPYSRIPCYRLPEALRDHAALADAQRPTFRES